MSITKSFKWMVVVLLMAAMIIPTEVMAASKTILPGIKWYDTSGNLIQAHGGGMIQVGNKYYWVGENKTGITDSGRFRGVSLYSTTNFADFTYEGEALTPQSTGDLTLDRIVERPKIIYNDSTSKYVMYMHIDDSCYCDAKVGVATSSSITGPWTYHGSYRPLDHEIRDMTIWKDTDGTAYLIGATDVNANFAIFKLSSDYLSVTNLVYQWNDVYLEAPAVVKDNGKYFILTSRQKGWTPTIQKYVSATSMSGAWSDWQTVGNSNNYQSQSTFVLPIQGTTGMTYLYMADRWNPSNLQDSRYIWLPLKIEGTILSYGYFDQWNLDATAGAFSTPSSFTGVTQNTWYKIKNLKSGLLLDISGQSTSDGAPAIQYTDNGGWNQQWKFVPIGNGYYQIINRYSGKALDVATGTMIPGNQLVQSSIVDSLSQQWSLQATAGGTFKMMNVNSLKAADVSGASTSPSGQVIQWDDQLQNNQQWSITIAN
ncbi:RICIN domain-containing protein [Paenibacillus antarcticus]|uniref:Ricin B lectin domain-containing protein n=1 Tax=Paenibacillus antarcticus TaxID=253703 RepID=A0A168MH90_9BACL|nr:RICIN domain-containing protein [Paenibacillus antarcticus]OAB44678.1 hypothetical protein PBAT_15570 [Paenibacillus antarcticus]